jgi:PIN like domain
VRILLDECVPRVLKQELSGCEVSTVRAMGWEGVKNGKLLSLAAQEFDVFLTIDRNMRYQQNVQHYEIAILVVITKTNRLEDILPLMPKVIATLKGLEPRTITEVSAYSTPKK